ncbi:MAG: hypothetical protein AAGH60_03880 [Pseudomonadota bacterium]
MKLLLAALAFAIAASAAQAHGVSGLQPIAGLTNEQEKAVRVAVRRALINQRNANFEEIESAVTSDGTIITCGYVRPFVPNRFFRKERVFLVALEANTTTKTSGHPFSRAEAACSALNLLPEKRRSYRSRYFHR